MLTREARRMKDARAASSNIVRGRKRRKILDYHHSLPCAFQVMLCYNEIKMVCRC